MVEVSLYVCCLVAERRTSLFLCPLGRGRTGLAFVGIEYRGEGCSETNVCDESNLRGNTFERPVKPQAFYLLSAPVDAQVQIRYTRPDGTKIMRVLTRTQKVTRSKKVAESSMTVRPTEGASALRRGTGRGIVS